MAFRTKSSEGDSVSQVKCAKCFNKRDQIGRHLHFLQFPNESALGNHLRQQYGGKAEEDGTVTAIQAWVRSMKSMYGDMVDENTGTRIPLWQAWYEAQRGIRPKVTEKAGVWSKG